MNTSGLLKAFSANDFRQVMLANEELTSLIRDTIGAFEAAGK